MHKDHVTRANYGLRVYIQESLNINDLTLKGHFEK